MSYKICGSISFIYTFFFCASACSRSTHWERTVKDDVRTAVELIAAPPSVNDYNDINQQIEDFSKKVSKYPSDKLKDIKNGVRQFIRFSSLYQEEFYNYISNFNTGLSFHFSDSAQVLFDSLYSYYDLTESMGSVKKISDTLTNRMKSDSVNIPIFKERFANHIKSDHIYFDAPFYKIFKEHIK